MKGNNKFGFYTKLAITGIQKNKRMYIPYLITCVSMVAMFYILDFLKRSTLVKHMSGGDTLQQILGLGSIVISVFSVLFLFYTNSFLIRRRKKEFGLYNILGMGKNSIARILFQETLIVAGISLGGGFVVGIALSKFAELSLLNLVQEKINYDFSICVPALKMGVLLFGIIFFLIFANALRQIHLAHPSELFNSEAVGEKAPKSNWFFGLLGFALLIFAYYEAVTIKQPLSAIVWFFIAVIMVIIATYLIFVSGSVLLCRILQKNKKYYYKTNHFVSVSSMVYRMKRNGAGLASICIMATMVLVMLSSSACLFFGEEDILNSRYPRNMVSHISFNRMQDNQSERIEQCRNSINELTQKHNIEISNIYDYEYADIPGCLDGDVVSVDANEYDMSQMSYEKLVNVMLVDAKYYTLFTGQKVELVPGEVWMYASGIEYQQDAITVGPVTYQITKHLEEYKLPGLADSLAMSTLVLIVPDMDDAVKDLKNLTYAEDSYMLMYTWYYEFDANGSEKLQSDLADEINEILTSDEKTNKKYGIAGQFCEALVQQKRDFFTTFGGLFFIGLLLSGAFLMATVLMIYYKQISEGYEDQERFLIMQNVGMTKTEIRSSINSQMLTVFFLPILFAGCHLAFAFPMIRKLLLLFGMNNLSLSIMTALGATLVFVLIYTIIYRITSNTYYNIVCKK